MNSAMLLALAISPGQCSVLAHSTKQALPIRRQGKVCDQREKPIRRGLGHDLRSNHGTGGAIGCCLRRRGGLAHPFTGLTTGSAADTHLAARWTPLPMEGCLFPRASTSGTTSSQQLLQLRDDPVEPGR